MTKLSVAGKRAKFFLKLLESKRKKTSCPLIVTLSLTPRCNFSCVYCYGDYRNRKEKEMSKKDIFKLLKELKTFGSEYLQLSGGEPLIREDIEEIVDYANKLGFCLGINTNGSLIKIKPQVVKKIGTVAISFDGEKKSNDLNRGHDTYEKIIEAINIAKSLGVNVHTYTTVTKNNVKSIDYVVKFAKKNNIYTEFGFLVTRSMKNDKAYRGIDLSALEFKKAVEKLISYKKKGYPILFSQKVMEKVLKWPNYQEKTWKNTVPPFDHIKCFAPKNQIFIDCDGKVYPCIQLIKNFEALDFRKVGFKKAYEKAHVHNCRACYLMCVGDLNLMFNLNPNALFNNIAISLKEIRNK